jgi:hypothetical protein
MAKINEIVTQAESEASLFLTVREVEARERFNAESLCGAGHLAQHERASRAPISGQPGRCGGDLPRGNPAGTTGISRCYRRFVWR